MTRKYLLVWVALMILLALTTGASYFPLGSLSTPVSMAIALLKTALVVAVYMHLADSKTVVRFFALAALAWLLIMYALTLCDVFSRVT
jgi:cytochrome c oxidase subunit 4